MNIILLSLPTQEAFKNHCLIVIDSRICELWAFVYAMLKQLHVINFSALTLPLLQQRKVKHRKAT